MAVTAQYSAAGARGVLLFSFRISPGRVPALPLFEYKCDKCGRVFEKIEKHSASVTKKCPQCGAKARRQLGAPAIQFKGSGWYVTDYGRKGSGAPGAKEGSGDGAAPKSGDQAGEKPAEKSAETKPAPEKSSTKKDKK
jgi:putative FmdB family regulatory protein